MLDIPGVTFNNWECVPQEGVGVHLCVVTNQHLALPCNIIPQEGVDVLVATPGRVATLLEAGVLNLEDCRAVILDEVRV